MKAKACDICKKYGREYNLCRKCMRLALYQWGMFKLFCSTVAFAKESLDDCKKYMRGEKR